MAPDTIDTSQCYLYGFVAPDAAFGDLPEGLEEASPRRVDADRASAVYSPIDVQGELRPRRRHIRAHHDVLDSLFDVTDVLPASFGTISHSADALRTMLEARGELLADELRRVEGTEEWRISVVIDGEDPFEYFVERVARLREERDRIYAGDAEPSRSQKVELGQLFERVLEEKRDETIDRLVDALDAHVRESAVEDPRSESGLAETAYLVEADRTDAFEGAVHEVAESFDDDLVFELTGPDLPYSFVEMELEFAAVA